MSTGLNNGVGNLTYNYPAGTNNGKIASKYDAVSGETGTYAYDAQNKRFFNRAGALDPLNNRNVYTVFYCTPTS